LIAERLAGFIRAEGLLIVINSVTSAITPRSRQVFSNRQPTTIHFHLRHPKGGTVITLSTPVRQSIR
jgi:hypothetical protein